MVRAAALYVPLCLTAIAWLASPPGTRERAAALLATAWNVGALLAVHVVATSVGWWTYGVADAVVAGFPVDLYVGWAVMWGAFPSLVGRRFSLRTIVCGAIAVDVLAMPRLHPFVQLGSTWLVGEAFAIAVCLIPAQLLAAWTRQDSHLAHRGGFQVIAFGSLALGVLPTIILEQSGDSWSALASRPSWVTGLLLQLVAIPALLGVSAVQEFALRGHGTPVPFDPPKTLVTTGPYAYVRNPMQLSATLVMLGWGAILESWWVVAAGVMAVVYGAGFAAGDEGADLVERFGPRWRDYADSVRSWVPRWRPVHPIGTSATLYVAEECGPCSEVRAWFSARGPRGLEIVAAERHPSRSLTRITYDPGDGSGDAVGVVALGRALEHVNLGWALIGMFVRLPGLGALLQLVTDASGGGPKRVVRYCERPGQEEPSRDRQRSNVKTA